MSTTSNVWARLRSKRYRDHFVAAQVKQAIPYQIRALMKDHGICTGETCRTRRIDSRRYFESSQSEVRKPLPEHSG